MAVSREIKVVLSFAALLLAFAGRSEASTLLPGEVLAIHFVLDAPLTLSTDTLVFSFGTDASDIQTIIEPYSQMTATLYGGSSAVGSSSTLSAFGNYTGAIHLGAAFSWTAPTSWYSFGNPGIVNFAPMLNSSMGGEIDISISSGEIAGLDLGSISITSGQSDPQFGASFTSMPFSPVVMSAVISSVATTQSSENPTPEPSTAALCLLGAMGILALLNKSSPASHDKRC
jgi:hypothetical protein